MSRLENSVHRLSKLEASIGQTLSCEFCGFSTKGEKQRRELRIHHDSVHFICSLCGNRHVLKSDLKVHLKKTHIEKCGFFVCGIGGCEHREKIETLKNGEIDAKFPNLFIHIRKQHCTLKYSCNVCKMQVTTVAFPRDHLSTEHNVETAIRPHKKCPTCDFVTQNKSKLMKHVKAVHLWEHLKFSSFDFETIIMNSETLKKHKENQRNKKLHCRHCSYKAKKTYHIQRHELTHSDVADYICDQCDFRTKTPQSLKVHSLYHEKAPKFICDQCQYTSFNNANFSTHRKTKHGTTQHKCDQCGETFQYLRHLSRHKDNHQAFKFNCEKCEKVFSRKDKLREHGCAVHDEMEVKASTKSVA